MKEKLVTNGFGLVGVIALAVMSMAVVPTPVLAGDVNSQLFPNAVNQLSDNSAEALLNCTAGADCSVAGGVPGGSGGTTVDVGDKLVGIFSINTVEDLTSGGGTHALGLNSGNSELTGVFSIQVTGKVPNGVGGCTSTFCFTFGPSSTFSTDVQTACGGACTLPSGITGTPSGAMIVMFDDPISPGDYSRTNPGGRSGNLATAYGGSLYAYFGFAGAANEFWQAGASTDDISVLRNIAPPTPGGAFNMGLSRLAGGIMIPLDVVDCLFGSVNLCGQGGLVGVGGADTDWHSFDNVDATIRPLIPEPSSVLLLGTGVAGLGLWRLRRNRSVQNA